MITISIFSKEKLLSACQYYQSFLMISSKCLEKTVLTTINLKKNVRKLNQKRKNQKGKEILMMIKRAKMQTKNRKPHKQTLQIMLYHLWIQKMLMLFRIYKKGQIQSHRLVQIQSHRLLLNQVQNQQSLIQLRVTPTMRKSLPLRKVRQKINPNLRMMTRIIIHQGKNPTL